MSAPKPSPHPPVRRWEVVSLAVLLAAFLLVFTALARRTGVTVDEPAHILSSILYWEGQDRLLPQDMPPLIKIAGGWAAAGARFMIPDDSATVWKTNHEWNVSIEMIRNMKERQIRNAMLRARLPMLIFPVLTALLLWWWGRELFSPVAGLAAAAFFVLEPTALGHSVLFKNDLAATFGYLLFWHRAWRYWREPGLANAGWLAVGTLAALLAKLSMLLVVPIAPLILLRDRKLFWKAAPLWLSLVWLGTFAAYQFDGVNRSPLYPPRLEQGVRALVRNNSGDNAVYLLGERRPHGHWGYFLVSTVMKAPLPLLAFIAAGAIAALRRRRPEDWLWMLPGLLYFVMASLSSLQLGVRLVLPCLPFALLGAAAAVDRLRPTRAWWLTPATAAALAALNISIYPHQLSYVNVLAGDPQQAARNLSGSDLDWGQDLWALRKYMQTHQIPKIKLSYFGTDNVWAYFNDQQVQWVQPPYSSASAKEPEYRPEPGYYAISVTLLTGQFFPPGYRKYYGAFQKMTPIGYAGHSIYIYRVS